MARLEVRNCESSCAASTSPMYAGLARSGVLSRYPFDRASQFLRIGGTVEAVTVSTENASARVAVITGNQRIGGAHQPPQHPQTQPDHTLDTGRPAQISSSNRCGGLRRPIAPAGAILGRAGDRDRTSASGVDPAPLVAGPTTLNSACRQPHVAQHGVAQHATGPAVGIDLDLKHRADPAYARAAGSGRFDALQDRASATTERCSTARWRASPGVWTRSTPSATESRSDHSLLKRS